MAIFNTKRALFIGAHTDDIELGSGGLLHQLAVEGVQITTLVFSNSQNSLPVGSPENLLIYEYKKAMASIGLDESVKYKLYPVRRFSEHRQDILEDLVSIRREFQPDLVITMNKNDVHQDHSIIHQESLRAFKDSTIISYELPWNQSNSQNNLFIQISDDDLDAKERMLLCYQSQIALKRAYISREYIESAAKFRGFQSRLPLAEAYEIIAHIWRTK